MIAPTSMAPPETQEITILGVFYGGRDYDTILQADPGARVSPLAT